MVVESGNKSLAVNIGLLSARNVFWLILIGCAALLWPSWVSLYEVWSARETYSHGYLIAIVSLVLLYQYSARLAVVAPQPLWWVLFPAGVSLFLWLLMRLAGIQVLELMLLPVIISLLSIASIGWRLSLGLFFPLFFLYFAIPLWHSGNFILQALTVLAVEPMVQLAGFTAYIEGNFVQIAAGTFEIADGCSGLHYFLVALTVSTLYAYLYLKTRVRQLLLVLIVAVMAMVMNWLRVFIVIYAGYATNMQHYLVTVDHYYFGWGLFLLVLLGLFLLAGYLSRGEPSIPVSATDSAITDSGATASVEKQQGVAKTSVIVCTVALSMLVLVAVVSGGRSMPTSVSSIESPVPVPAAQSGWVQQPARFDWNPHFEGANSEWRASYQNNKQIIDLYVNYYSSQQQGQELVGFNNRIEGTAHWNVSAQSSQSLQLPARPDLVHKRMLLQSEEGGSRIIYYWYDVDGFVAANGLLVRLNYGLRRMFSDAPAGIVAVSAKCLAADCGDADSLIKDWLQVVWDFDDWSLLAGAIKNDDKKAD